MWNIVTINLDTIFKCITLYNNYPLHENKNQRLKRRLYHRLKRRYRRLKPGYVMLYETTTIAG